MTKYAERPVTAIGTLFKNPEKKERSTRLFVRLETVNDGSGPIDVTSRLVAYTQDKSPSLTYGDRIELRKVKFKKIKNYKNPGSFNIEQFYNRKDIFYSTFVDERNISILGKSTSVNPFLYKINLIRTKYSNFVTSNTTYPESTIINALTVGNKSNIPTDIREIFSGLGIAHIFAISGLHVGAIAVGFYFLIKWLLKRSEYILLSYEVPRIAAMATILPVFIYTALAGFSISAVRAFIMITIYLLSIAVGKEGLKLNTLFIAAIVILFINPNSLFELSFQLSFLSVFGILFTFNLYSIQINTWSGKIKTALITTAAASFITLPIIINTFGILPVFSIPANLLLVPFVEFLIVPLGLISLLTFETMPSVSILLISIDSYFISLLLRITEWLKLSGLATITAPRVSLTTTFFLMLTAVILLLRKQFKKINYILPLSVLMGLIFVAKNFYNYNPVDLEINILDSGSKNIALLKTDSDTILISGGYSRKSKSDFIEKSVVIPFLLHNNITQIDHLIITSLDKSHINGTSALLKKIDIKNIWINGYKLNNELWEQIYEKNVNLEKIQDQQKTIKNNGLSFSFLRPIKPYSVYDSKLPSPLLLEIEYNNYIFHMGERTKHGIFENKKSDLLYIDEDSRLKGDIIINNYKPGNIVCKKCKDNFPGYFGNIFETDTSGSLTVTIKNNKIKIREYTNK